MDSGQSDAWHQIAPLNDTGFQCRWCTNGNRIVGPAITGATPANFGEQPASTAFNKSEEPSCCDVLVNPSMPSLEEALCSHLDLALYQANECTDVMIWCGLQCLVQRADAESYRAVPHQRLSTGCGIARGQVRVAEGCRL